MVVINFVLQAASGNVSDIFVLDIHKLPKAKHKKQLLISRKKQHEYDLPIVLQIYRKPINLLLNELTTPYSW